MVPKRGLLGERSWVKRLGEWRDFEKAFGGRSPVRFGERAYVGIRTQFSCWIRLNVLQWHAYNTVYTHAFISFNVRAFKALKRGVTASDERRGLGNAYDLANLVVY